MLLFYLLTKTEHLLCARSWPTEMGRMHSCPPVTWLELCLRETAQVGGTETLGVCVLSWPGTNRAAAGGAPVTY